MGESLRKRSSVGGILNLALTPAFILGQGFGIEGAAWAAVLSQAAGLLILDAEALSEDEGGRERKIEDAAREQRAHADDGKALASEQVVEGEARAHDGRADEKNLGVAHGVGHDRGRRAQDPEERLVKE